MKHTRKCALATCNKEFKTNRMWQIFCCKAHQEEYWRLYRYSESPAINKLNKRLEGIEKSWGWISEKNLFRVRRA